MYASHLQDTIREKERRIHELNETEPLRQQIRRNTDVINQCRNRHDIRKKYSLQVSNSDIRKQIDRNTHKIKLFGILKTGVQEASQLMSVPPTTMRCSSKIKNTAAQESAFTQSYNKAFMPPQSEQELIDQVVNDASLIFEDVILIDDGEHLQDARAQVDDVCMNCNTLMERNLQLSYLVCPNIDCGHMRWYMDTSTYTSSNYSPKSDMSKSSPKCVTHYSTFLNTSQGKTTKRFTHEKLTNICFFCYVVGARKPEDITKKMINKAQKFMGGTTEYNISTILKTQLRGNSLRLPPEVIKKLQLLFKAMWPVFAHMKQELDSSRANMINFNFVSRVLCRLLGYDIFLTLFDTFTMERNEIRHSAFMRQMFHKLGWVWEDRKLTDIPDNVLDEYEERELLTTTGYAFQEFEEEEDDEYEII